MPVIIESRVTSQKDVKKGVRTLKRSFLTTTTLQPVSRRQSSLQLYRLQPARYNRHLNSLQIPTHEYKKIAAP